MQQTKVKPSCGSSTQCTLLSHALEICKTFLYWSYMRVSMGLTANRQNGQKIDCQPSKTQYFYRQPSNEQANISHQMAQIPVIIIKY